MVKDEGKINKSDLRNLEKKLGNSLTPGQYQIFGTGTVNKMYDNTRFANIL